MSWPQYPPQTVQPVASYPTHPVGHGYNQAFGQAPPPQMPIQGQYQQASYSAPTGSPNYAPNYYAPPQQPVTHQPYQHIPPQQYHPQHVAHQPPPPQQNYNYSTQQIPSISHPPPHNPPTLAYHASPPSQHPQYPSSIPNQGGYPLQDSSSNNSYPPQNSAPQATPATQSPYHPQQPTYQNSTPQHHPQSGSYGGYSAPPPQQPVQSPIAPQQAPQYSPQQFQNHQPQQVQQNHPPTQHVLPPQQQGNQFIQNNTPFNPPPQQHNQYNTPPQQHQYPPTNQLPQYSPHHNVHPNPPAVQQMHPPGSPQQQPHYPPQQPPPNQYLQGHHPEIPPSHPKSLPPKVGAAPPKQMIGQLPPSSSAPSINTGPKQTQLGKLPLSSSMKVDLHSNSGPTAAGGGVKKLPSINHSGLTGSPSPSPVAPKKFTASPNQPGSANNLAPPNPQNLAAVNSNPTAGQLLRHGSGKLYSKSESHSAVFDSNNVPPPGAYVSPVANQPGVGVNSGIGSAISNQYSNSPSPGAASNATTPSISPNPQNLSATPGSAGGNGTNISPSGSGFNINDIAASIANPRSGSPTPSTKEATKQAKYSQYISHGEHLSDLPSKLFKSTERLAAHTIEILDSPKLTRITSKLSQMTKLTSLTIRQCGLTCDVGNESSLHTICLVTSLTKLDLGCNKLATIPADIASLASLTSLALDGNQLSSLPLTINTLAGLTSLDLSMNFLSTLDLFAHKKLTYLNVGKNSLRDWPANFQSCNDLATLDISDNQLGQIHPTIFRLPKLSALILSGNQFRAIPPDIIVATKLVRLCIDSNRLSSLPPELFTLTKLTELKLGRNQLKDLPESIGNMSHLRRLELDTNGFDSLPHQVATLPYLDETKLTFAENPLSDIPAEIRTLGPGAIFRFLKQLTSKAPWRRMKLMLVGNGNIGKTSLKRALSAHQGGHHSGWSSEGSHKLKVVGTVFGHAASTLSSIKSKIEKHRTGKSGGSDSDSASDSSNSSGSFHHANSAGSLFDPTLDTIATDGIDIDDWIIDIRDYPEAAETAGIKLELLNHDSSPDNSHNSSNHNNSSSTSKDDPTLSDYTAVFSCYDFAGQDVYYPTHSLFITSRSIYLIMFSLLDMEASRVDYWVQMVHSRAMFSSPAIIVATHEDDKRVDKKSIPDILASVKKKYCGRYPFIKDVVAISSKTGYGLPKLRNSILTLALSHSTMKEQVPRSYILLETEIKKRRKIATSRTMSKRDWDDLAVKCSIKPEDTASSLRFMADVGVVFHFTTPQSESNSTKPKSNNSSSANLNTSSSSVSSGSSSPRGPGNAGGLNNSRDRLTRSGSMGSMMNPLLAPKKSPIASPAGVRYPTIGSPRSIPPVNPPPPNPNPGSPRLNQQGQQIGPHGQQLVGQNSTANLKSSFNELKMLGIQSNKRFQNPSFLEVQQKALDDIIILDPQWIADILSTVISLKHNFVKDGIMESSCLPQLWKSYPLEFHESMLQLLKKFEIILPLSEDGKSSVASSNDSIGSVGSNGGSSNPSLSSVGKYIIPSMLPVHQGEDPIAKCWSQGKSHLQGFVPGKYFDPMARVFAFRFLPMGFFGRLVARCIYTPGLVISSYSNNSLVADSVNYTERCCVAFNDITSELLIWSQSYIPIPPSERKLFHLILDVLENLYESLYYSNKRSIHLVCCHCIKSGIQVPSLFEYEDALIAVTSGKDSLSCPQPNSNNSQQAPPAGGTENSTSHWLFDSTLYQILPDFVLRKSKLVGSATGSALVSKHSKHTMRSSAESDSLDTSSSQDSVSSTAGNSGSNHHLNQANGVSVSLDRLAPDVSFAAFGDMVVPFEQIVLGRHLATGGFAEVYQSTFRDNVVAVKKFLQEGMESEEMENVFRELQHEVFLMAKLNHPNLVKLHALCVHPICMIMEFVPCGTLGDVVYGDKAKVMSWPLRLRLAKDIAAGLAYLHSEGIAHLDFRSPNILIQSLNENEVVCAKIADFGLSTTTSASHKGVKAFNCFWAAPEIIKQQSFGLKADIYSFGIIMWELLQYGLPFEEFAGKYQGGPEIVFANDIAAGLRPNIPNDCPDSWRKLMTNCWQEKPQSRPTADDALLGIYNMISEYQSQKWPNPSVGAKFNQK